MSLLILKCFIKYKHPVLHNLKIWKTNTVVLSFLLPFSSSTPKTCLKTTEITEPFVICFQH